MFRAKRKLDENGQYPKNDEYKFVEELGVGMSIYFKTLKSLALMFLMFTFFSIPAFVLFYSGNVSDISNVYDTKSIFSAFTLGNLG